VETLLDKSGVEVTGQITETSDKVDELQEWIENHPLPESKIIGPEADVVCSEQSIALEVHNLPQPPTRCRGITSNLMKSLQWAFYLDYQPGDSHNWDLYLWDLLSGEQTLKYPRVTDTVGTNIYSFPN
jgi:hypothetical protein